MSLPAHNETVVPQRIRVTAAPAGDPVRGRLPRVLSFASNPVGNLDGDDEFEPRRTLSRELPDPAPFAATLTRNTLEVLACERSLGQLMRWVDHEIYQSLARRVAIRSRQPRSRARRMVVVRSVRVCQVSRSAVEASVVVSEGSHVRAVALRLEALDHRWRCTALEIG